MASWGGSGFRCRASASVWLNATQHDLWKQLISAVITGCTAQAEVIICPTSPAGRCRCCCQCLGRGTFLTRRRLDGQGELGRGLGLLPLAPSSKARGHACAQKLPVGPPCQARLGGSRENSSSLAWGLGWGAHAWLVGGQDRLSEVTTHMAWMRFVPPVPCVV